MANDNLTLLEIQDLIIKFNLDESINDLKKYYATLTTWEIMKQSRRETTHTQFLAWFFNNNDFNADLNAGPIKRFIVLLLKWANRQKGAEFNSELADSIYQQDFSIISHKVVPEYSIKVEQKSNNGPAYGEGNIDIFFTVLANIFGTKRTIHIVVENKIGAPETTKCFDKNGKLLKKPTKEETNTTLYQTNAYYQYIATKYNSDINLFVYLKPTECSLDDLEEAECNEKKFIQINYQELLDYVIQPVSEQIDISTDNAYRLKDYIKALGKPSETDDNETDNKDNSNKKITIMAIEQKEKELLKQFFHNNEDLIRAAINALGDSELSASMAKMPKSRVRRSYTINNSTEEYSMYGVIEKFVEKRLKDGKTIDEINTEINNYIGGNRVNISDNISTPVCRETYKDGTHHYGEITVNGTKIRYTKEWGGDENGNFTKFKNAVNAKKYPNFQINEIQ